MSISGCIEEEARNVKMANLGILQTRASGTCVAHFTHNGVSTKVKLKDCLHAPNAFINLLSVDVLMLRWLCLKTKTNKAGRELMRDVTRCCGQGFIQIPTRRGKM